MKLITAIIPLRLVPGIFQATERLGRLMDTIPADLYEVLVVDYGSKEEEAETIARTCDGYDHVRIVRVREAEEKIFSIGAARDIGVQHARAPVVMFNDIDFHAPTEGYRRIADEVRARRVATDAYNFFTVPVVFLTEEGNRAYWACEEAWAKIHLVHDAYTSLDTELIQFMAFGSSAMVVNTHHYLALGGHSPQFFGHGAEDYDVLHRLAAYYRRGPRPRSYHKDLKNNQINDYTGFRAYFALYGIDVWQRGVFLVHLWHPTRAMKNYMQSSRNFTILKRLMREFDKERKQPPALEAKSCKHKTLLLAEPTSRACRSLRHAIPLMGRVVIRPETVFDSPQSLKDFIASEKIDIVGFLNPYGNGHREKLYQAVRKAGIRFWTFDRGALPDSWFFDPAGFNYDSSTYASERWDEPLSDADRAAAQARLKELRQTSSTLEVQGPRYSVRHWQNKFGIGGRKVLFVPLQRPNDTVVRCFSGACGDYEGFRSWVRFVAEKLDPRHWVVIAKRHPLEDEQIDLGPRVKYVPKDAHIHDLIELSDKVMLLNSGTGVLAMGFGRPTIVCGQAFYRYDGLNWQANSAEEALELVRDGNLRVAAEKVERFYHHLTHEVYSFGPSAYVERVDDQNRRIRLAEDIIFSSIRGLGPDPVLLGEPDAGVSLDAPLFFSFGGREEMLRDPEKPRRRPTPRRKELVSGAIAPLVPERLKDKLKADPVRFFADSKSAVVRGIGKILL